MNFQIYSCYFSTTLNYYLCDFAVRDIKIVAYLESPRKINFNLVSDFFIKWNFWKKRVLTINNKVQIYLHLWPKNYKNYFFITEI